MALLETLEVYVFNFHDGSRSAGTILDFERRETMYVALTSHLVAQLKGFPTPSRGARPIANSPDKFIDIRCQRDTIWGKPTCVIWLTPWATTSCSASRVHSIEKGFSGRMGFVSEEEKWANLSVKKSICWRSNGMAAQVKQSRSVISNTASTYINSHPRHACMLSTQIGHHLPFPNPLCSSCLR